MLDAFGALIVVNMSRVKRRKMRPQPPRYFWPDTDGCWMCENRNGCSGCKFLKRYIAEGKDRNKRKILRDEKKLLDNS